MIVTYGSSSNTVDFVKVAYRIQATTTNVTAWAKVRPDFTVRCWWCNKTYRRHCAAGWQRTLRRHLDAFHPSGSDEQERVQ